MKTHSYSFPISVYFEDIDYGGVVYHPNYIKYMERARTAWAEQLNAGTYALAQQQIYFVVKNITIEYLYPARMHDQLMVMTQLEKLGRTSLVLQQDICFEKQPEKFLTKAEVVLVCVDGKMKPRALPEKLVENLAS